VSLTAFGKRQSNFARVRKINPLDSANAIPLWGSFGS
jgi:hypothetical protein